MSKSEKRITKSEKRKTKSEKRKAKNEKRKAKNEKRKTKNKPTSPCYDLPIDLSGKVVLFWIVNTFSQEPVAQLKSNVMGHALDETTLI